MEKELLFNVAEIKISYHPRVKPSERPTVNHSRDAAEIFRQAWNNELMEVCEEAMLMCMNGKGRVLGLFRLSRGTISTCCVDPRMVFLLAVNVPGTSGIILCHNHPTGDTRPSKQDELLTEKIKQGGAILDIRLKDHIILSTESYLSMADEGQI